MLPVKYFGWGLLLIALCTSPILAQKLDVPIDVSLAAGVSKSTTTVTMVVNPSITVSVRDKNSPTITIGYIANLFTTTPEYATYRTGAICNDGWRSYSTGSGTCSGHRGVRNWTTMTECSRYCWDDTTSNISAVYVSIGANVSTPIENLTGTASVGIAGANLRIAQVGVRYKVSECCSSYNIKLLESSVVANVMLTNTNLKIITFGVNWRL
jgi:hypothetical protein